MNVLDVADQQRILTLLGRGWSIRRVSRETGYRHETIRRYGIEAGILKPRSVAKCITPGEVPTDPKPHTRPEVPTDPAATRSSAEPFRAFVETELANLGFSYNCYSEFNGALFVEFLSCGHELVALFCRQENVECANRNCIRSALCRLAFVTS
jgi:hypothetical protein